MKSGKSQKSSKSGKTPKLAAQEESLFYSEIQSKAEDNNSAVLEHEDSGNPFHNPQKSSVGSAYKDQERMSNRSKNKSKQSLLKKPYKNLAKMLPDQSNTIMTTYNHKNSQNHLEVTKDSRKDLVSLFGNFDRHSIILKILLIRQNLSLQNQISRPQPTSRIEKPQIKIQSKVLKYCLGTQKEGFQK